jgi:hypothetical protein
MASPQKSPRPPPRHKLPSIPSSTQSNSNDKPLQGKDGTQILDRRNRNTTIHTIKEVKETIEAPTIKQPEKPVELPNCIPSNAPQSGIPSLKSPGPTLNIQTRSILKPPNSPRKSPYRVEFGSDIIHPIPTLKKLNEDIPPSQIVTIKKSSDSPKKKKLKKSPEKVQEKPVEKPMEKSSEITSSMKMAIPIMPVTIGTPTVPSSPKKNLPLPPPRSTTPAKSRAEGNIVLPTISSKNTTHIPKTVETESKPPQIIPSVPKLKPALRPVSPSKNPSVTENYRVIGDAMKAFEYFKRFSTFTEMLADPQHNTYIQSSSAT